MATIINHPPERVVTSDDSGVGIVVGFILALAIIVLFLVFGIPYLRSASNTNGGVDSRGPNTTQPGAGADVRVNIIPTYPDGAQTTNP